MPIYYTAWVIRVGAAPAILSVVHIMHQAWYICYVAVALAILLLVALDAPRILVATIAAIVATGVFAHIMPSRKHTRPSKPMSYVGGAVADRPLLHLGINSCYINSVIQLLYSIPEIRTHVLDNRYGTPFNDLNYDACKYNILEHTNVNKITNTITFTSRKSWSERPEIDIGRSRALYIIFWNMAHCQDRVVWGYATSTYYDTDDNMRIPPELSKCPPDENYLPHLLYHDVNNWIYSDDARYNACTTLENPKLDLFLSLLGPYCADLFGFVYSGCVYENTRHPGILHTAYILPSNSTSGKAVSPNITEICYPCIEFALLNNHKNLHEYSCLYEVLPKYLLIERHPDVYVDDYAHTPNNRSVATQHTTGGYVSYNMVGAIMREGASSGKAATDCNHYIYLDMPDDDSYIVYNDVMHQPVYRTYTIEQILQNAIYIIYKKGITTTNAEHVNTTNINTTGLYTDGAIDEDTLIDYTEAYIVENFIATPEFQQKHADFISAHTHIDARYTGLIELQRSYRAMFLKLYNILMNMKRMQLSDYLLADNYWEANTNNDNIKIMSAWVIFFNTVSEYCEHRLLNTVCRFNWPTAPDSADKLKKLILAYRPEYPIKK